jgi:cardiolipin synthase
MSAGRRTLTAPAQQATFHLLPGGTLAFDRILHRIDGARRSVAMRCFDWRDDETGEAIATALLHAADRGTQVTILKDRVGMHYEYLESSKQSFFHKKIDLRTRLQTWFLMTVYGQWGSLRQKANPLVATLLEHPNVKVVHDERRFDHAKVYVFDDETVILGGMGVGDDFRLANVDFMVEIAGAGAAARLAARYEGRAAFDPGRPFDYLLHSFRLAGGGEQESLAQQRLRLIASARERLTVEMAYMGDRRYTDALVDAVDRGVAVTLLTAARANVIADLNLHTCDQILRRTRSPEHLRIFLHPRMVHGKAVVVDGRWVDIGSANFTPLSHGAYEEVDLYCDDPGLAAAVEDAVERDIQDSVPARAPVRFRRIYVLVERAISAYHSRKYRR